MDDVGDVFVTGRGDRIVLDPAHSKRQLMRGGTGYAASWNERSDDEAILAYLREAADRVRLGVHMLQLFGGEVAGRDVLVIGAGDGAEAALLAGMGAASVVGTDYGDPFVGDARHDPKRERLLDVFRRRGADAGLGDSTTRGPRFVVDDITRSRLTDASFDVAVSWQTLEHVMDPAAAMRTLARVLRPGGLAYHEYNPFFAIDGGHALCTLATPWGHVRLDDADVERYLHERTPDVAAEAMAFYRGGLNRATQADLLAAIEGAGLQTLAFVPRSRTEDVLLLTPETWRDARRNYPGVTVNDLVCRIVRVVVRRNA